jgi:glycosyltransferase involved in cell wall biosynthesis
MMRILLTVPSLDTRFGGPPAVAAALRSALRDLGHRVEVVGCGDAPDALGLPLLGRFRGTPIPRRLGPILRATERADLVHLLGYRDPVGTVAALGARSHGVPYLVEPMGMHRRRLSGRTRKAAFDAMFGGAVLRHASVIVASSRIEADELAEDGLSHRRIRLRANGVERPFPHPPRGILRSRLALTPETPLVLSLGRIAAKKGLLDLVAAVRRLREVTLVVAGPDDGDGTRRALERSGSGLARTRRLFVLPDGLWGREKAAAFADADVFCLPSATENFGIAAAEAAVAGVPVVVSDRCGVAEWLEPEAARVVPFGRVDALVVALQDALHDERMGTAARAAAPRLAMALQWGALARRQADIYREALGPPHPSEESGRRPRPLRDERDWPVPLAADPGTLKRPGGGAD